MAKQVKKHELGRGIRALLTNIESQPPDQQLQTVKELTHTVAMIPLEQIGVNPFQPRKDFDIESLEELAHSLRTHGLIQPLTVRRLSGKEYQLISGERRLRASRIAGLTEVPAYIRLANDQEMIEMALVENIQREDLNAIEVAITYQRLIDECDLTHEALSQRVGKQRSTVTNFLRLLKLPPDIQKALKSNVISMGHARSLLGVEDLSLLLTLFREVVQKDLSVRATEALVRRYKSPPTKSTPDAASLPADYRAVRDNLRSFLGTKVDLSYNANGTGAIKIPFTSDKELNRILDLIEKD